MHVYDLLLKIEGLKGVTNDGLADDFLNSVLFPTFGTQDRRSRFSNLKSGKNPLTLDHANSLTEEFNARISRTLRANGRTPYLRAEDWYRPLPEFFAQLGTAIGDDAMLRANAGMMTAIQGFETYRERDHALVVERFNPTRDLTRFPVSAEPVDPVELPRVRLRPGEEMMMRIAHSVAPTSVRAWLFYVRTPDPRDGDLLPQLLWQQEHSEFVFWHAGGPFELAANFVGPLPGFPAHVADKPGSVTAFLLLEPLNSGAIAELLREPTRRWDGTSAPSFEGAIHLVTCARRLFQRGASLRFDKGDLSYPPPKLLVRRYKIAS